MWGFQETKMQYWNWLQVQLQMQMGQTQVPLQMALLEYGPSNYQVKLSVMIEQFVGNFENQS